MIVLAAGVSACSKGVEANDLAVGECIANEIDGPVGAVDTVDCDEPHRYEVYAKFDLEGDEYPGAGEAEAAALVGCSGERFEAYVGVPYDDSDLHARHLVPTEDSWDGADDRTIICLAFTPLDTATPTDGAGEVEGTVGHASP